MCCAIGNFGGQHIGNLGNFLGTHWEQKKKSSNISPYPPKTQKEKNLGPSLSLSMFEPSHWMHENYILKIVCQHFSGGLMESIWEVWVLYW